MPAQRSKSKKPISPTRRSILSPVATQYLSVAGCERVSSLSAWTWRRYAYCGVVASAKIGGRLVIPVSEVNRIMQAGMRPALAEIASPAEKR